MPNTFLYFGYRKNVCRKYKRDEIILNKKLSNAISTLTVFVYNNRNKENIPARTRAEYRVKYDEKMLAVLPIFLFYRRFLGIISKFVRRFLYVILKI